MTTDLHPVAPEDVMALMDGELAADEARAVAAHLKQCAECGRLARQLRGVSESLAGWTVPPVPSSLEESLNAAATQAASGRKPAKPARTTSLSFWNWRLRTFVGVGVAAAILILLATPMIISYYSDHVQVAKEEMARSSSAAPNAYIRPQVMSQLAASKQRQPAMSAGVTGIEQPAPPPPTPGASAASAVRQIKGRMVADEGLFGGSQPASAPMIARTVSLTIVVKDFPAARAALDSILARHNGYAAQLTVSTPENAQRSVQASLRIPAQELARALTDLRSLGRVENEAQSGEEVTQQHADLVARLQNSRETEQRLRAILEQRTGKIDDVLQVEEEIARVRGEIEGMEAEQKNLEHRVDFATVELQLSEEFKAQLNAPSPTVSTRMHNAFVSGIGSAANTLLGFVLFFEEAGPVLLVWLAILGLPIFFVWRRYRRMRAAI